MNDLNPSSKPSEGIPNWTPQSTEEATSKAPVKETEGASKASLSDIKSTISQAQQMELSKNFPDIPKLVSSQFIQFNFIPREQAVFVALNTLLETMEELIKLIPEEEVTATGEAAVEKESEIPIEGEEPMQPGEVSEEGAPAPVKQEAEKEKPASTVSMTKYLAALTMVVQEVKNMEMALRGGMEGKSRNLVLAMAALAELQEPATSNKQLLLSQLEGLKGMGKNISTGYRIILGEHPDIMLQLQQAGITPPLNGGGPYDGMAKQLAEAGSIPYDNPVYAEMAKSLPGGWEELSVSELDQVIKQVEQMPDASPVRSSRLIKAVANQSILLTTMVLRPLIIKQNIFQLVTLRTELEALKNTKKASISSDLKNRLAAQGIGNFSLTRLNIINVDRAINQINQKINAQMASMAGIAQPAAFAPFGAMNSLIVNGLTSLVDRQVMRVLQDVQRYGFDAGTSSLRFFMLSPSQQETVRMVTASIVLTQAIAVSVNPPVGRNMARYAEQTIDSWIGTQQANRIVRDLFGFSGTHAFERELMANAIVSFAVVSTLVNAFRTPRDELLSTLQTLAKVSTYMGPARVAIALIQAEKMITNASAEVEQQVKMAALKTVIAELLKGIQADQEKLEQLETLKALILEMMNQIIQMLAGVGTVPSTGDDKPVIEPVVPLQG